MIPFVAAGAAAGGLSYFVGLPLAYAAFLAVAIVAVAVAVSSALNVKVPQVEPKVRKTKAEKSKDRSKVDKARHSSTPAPSTAPEDDTDSSSKDEKSEDTKADTKVNNKREKERAKKAAKKEVEEKNKKAEAERVAAEEKAAAKAAAAEKKAAEEAEKERLAALETVEDEGEDEAPAKKKNKKKKKKTEEKKNVEIPASNVKPSETKASTTTKVENAKKVEEAPAPVSTAKKTETKKPETSSAAASAPSKKTEAPKSVEQPTAAPESKLEAKETKSAPQESSAWEEVKGGKKSRRVAEPVVATPTSSSDEQKVDIFLDPKSFGVIIGKAGSTLKLITDATQTSIDLSKKEEGRVTVSGSSRENIDKAIDAMNQLASKGYSVLTHGRRDEGSIEVPPSKRFNVIGAGGQTVRLIQEKLKVKINLPERNTADSTVTVLGDSANVQKAIECITELIEKGYSEVTHSGFVSETVEVPSGQMGSIIGTGGAMIKEIQDSTGAKLNTEGSTVVIVGERSQVTEAVNKITQLLTPPEPLPADPEWSREASSRYVDLW